MGKTFQKIHASSVGSFGGNGDKISQWIRVNGGNYSKEVSDKVTHLITTTDAYKKNVEAVQTAKRLGTIKIVSFDWLEDSLMSKTRKPKRETPYLLETILRTSKTKSEKTEKAPISQKQSGKPKQKYIFGKRKSSSASVTEPSDSAVYTDATTGTTYAAILTRQLPSKTSREKYQVKIYQSNTEPRTYATYSKYSRVGRSKTEFLAPLGSTLDVALAKFEQIFEDKAGKKWENRLDGIPPPLKQDDNGNPLTPHEGWFSYDGEHSLISNFPRQGPATAGNEETNDVSQTDEVPSP
ncbi:brct domain protein [Aspergillus terreus]|uniref:Brct domain protein n=1 Tax=Aspergillus terreus TaxID=33178 RepID=A0A5M3YRT3_ASPTE|nr:hypothetical protein ATETN484_0003044500 [Aspergillus terreus]GFF14434.1 brct domain protein [Aspergillus terreus]